MRLWLQVAVLSWSVLVWPIPATSAQETPDSKVISLAELQDCVSTHGRAIRSFRIAGVVCAVVLERNLVALQDTSATVLLELPKLDGPVSAGDWLAIEGTNCAITRSRHAIQLGTAPVVNVGGDHPVRQKSGSVFLRAAPQPIRLSWFNGMASFALNAEYEGPGVARQKVPDSVLWHKAGGPTNQSTLQPGLDFAAYVGEAWHALPDFGHLPPVARGTASNFDLACRVRDENTALVFSGMIRPPNSGVYTFYLTSDDGSELYVGEPAAFCKVVSSGGQARPVTSTLEEALAHRAVSQWIELEGTATFFGADESGLELELATRAGPAQVTIVDGSSLLATNLSHKELRLAGICQVSQGSEQTKLARITVPGAGQVQIARLPKQGVTPASLRETVLTSADQIRRLKREEAALHLPANLAGVITCAALESIVLQDASAGVYILFGAGDWADQPRVGEYWEISGTTDPGDFSPVIKAQSARFLGRTTLPEPIRPAWDQLMNGSLDAQYVEIRGAITALSAEAITLLTADGKLSITRNFDHPLPYLPSLPSGGGPDRSPYLYSVVRLRGCLTAEWRAGPGQVSAGVIHLSPAIIEVEDRAPADPFSVATRKAVDLLQFDARASALQRTKVAGQLIHARPPEYFLLDGATGLRFITQEPLRLQVGDLVEAVGFPQLGRRTPIVLEAARARKTGLAPLPPPQLVAAEDLLDHRRDSTLAQIEAVLVSETLRPTQRILELQSGAYHFLARLNSGRGTLKPLERGSRLQLTGIYSSVPEDYGDTSLDEFELLLNSAEGVQVLQRPSWWTVRRAILLAAALAGSLGVALVWITLLRRKVEERTAQLQREIEQRQRVEAHRAMEQERIRVAQDLHDELGAGLTEMGILASLVKNPSVPADQKARCLDQLAEAARSLVTGLDEIVWAVNPHYDSVGSLASYYSLFGQRFLNLAGIACRLQIAERFPRHPLDARIRHGIFLAFKEALNNVVRHSGAKEVRLQIEIAEDQLVIVVADSGRGFDPAANGPGKDGLAGMCERLAKLGGTCQIASQPGRGTTVHFRFPLDGVVPSALGSRRAQALISSPNDE